MYRNVVMWVVDDNPGDIRLYQEFFKSNNFLSAVNYLGSYNELLACLQHEKTPDLVFLSMHLLVLSGLQNLQMIKSEPRFENLPFVALTSSDEEQPILEDVAHYISHYLTKPLEIGKVYDLFSTMESLAKFREGVVAKHA